MLKFQQLLIRKYYKNFKEKAGRNKTLIQNFSYLSALQVFNILLPLITYPYLIRVLGKETYGLVIFAQAIIGYLLILVGFGFNISATKEISIHRENKEKLNEIVSSVILIKVGLFLISMLILSTLIFFIPSAQEYKVLFFLTMWMCLYDVIFPLWYFQGIENMKYITYITLTSRLTFFTLIFVLIHSPADYLYIPIINGIGALFAGITSLYIIFARHKVKFAFQSYQILRFYFKDSIPIFVSNISIKLYVSTNKVIVGAFLGMGEVAYYDLGEKISTILKIPQSIIGQSIFPKISKDKNSRFVKRMFKVTIFLNTALYIFVLLFSKQIIVLLGGSQMLNAVIVVNILAFTIPIIAMSNIFGIQLLIPFGHNKAFSKVIVLSGLFYFIQAMAIWLTVSFSLINVSIITVTTEVFCASFLFYYCKKYHLWI